jgi:hypothetical protein
VPATGIAPAAKLAGAGRTRTVAQPVEFALGGAASTAQAPHGQGVIIIKWRIIWGDHLNNHLNDFIICLETNEVYQSIARSMVFIDNRNASRHWDSEYNPEMCFHPLMFLHV